MNAGRAGKTVLSEFPERLRGVFTTRRYTNPRLLYFTLLFPLEAREPQRPNLALSDIGIWTWGNVLSQFNEFDLVGANCLPLGSGRPEAVRQRQHQNP